MDSTNSKPLDIDAQALLNEAAILDQEHAIETAPPPDPNAPPPPDFAGDALGLVNIAAEGLAAFYPSTGKVLDGEARGKIAGALAPVMEKYGLTLAGFFGRWGPEISLAFVGAQLAIPLAKAISADRAQAKALADTTIKKAQDSSASVVPAAPGDSDVAEAIKKAAETPAASLFAKA